jgi:hypothetical protein
VLGIIGWSIATKVRTGSGLPAGPSGLLGAVEGFSYLSLLGGEARLVLFVPGHCSGRLQRHMLCAVCRVQRGVHSMPARMCLHVKAMQSCGRIQLLAALNSQDEQLLAL